MLARMFGEIDPLLCDAHRGEGGSDRRGRRRDEREHRAVVRRVGLHIEQLRARHSADRRAQRVDGGGITPLGEVRYAFDQRRGHQLFLNRSMSQRCIAALPATSDPFPSLLSTSDAPSCRVTMPPASRMSNVPAAMSHGASCCSQKPSSRPAATSARSRAAAPARRTPLAAPITAANCARYTCSTLSDLKGKPVPMSACLGSVIAETLRRVSSSNAPPPRIARYVCLRQTPWVT